MSIPITPRSLGTIDQQMCVEYRIDRIGLLVHWRVSEGTYLEETNALGNQKFQMMGGMWDGITPLLDPQILARFAAALVAARPALVEALDALDENHDLTDPQGQINLGTCMNMLDDIFQGPIESYFAEVWLPAHTAPQFNPVIPIPGNPE